MVNSLITTNGVILEGSLVPSTEVDTGKAIQALFDWGCCPRCVFRLLGIKDQSFFRDSSNKNLKEELKNYLEAKETGTNSKPKGIGVANVAISPADTVENRSTDLNCIERMETCDTVEKDKDADEYNNGAAGNTDMDCEEGTGTVCVSCVGILQDFYSSEDYLHQIQRRICEDNREFSTYFCSITIPVPLLVRERALWLKLMELGINSFSPGAFDEIIPVKDMWKWVNGSRLATLLGAPFDQKSCFEVSLIFVNADLDKECYFLYDVFPDIFKKRKQNKHGWEVFTNANVGKAMKDMSDAKFKRYYHCPPSAASSKCDCDKIAAYHEQIYLAGRYQKFSRELSQTPWVVDGGRKTESSIQELICESLMELVRAAEYRFSSAGREDVDVRMLGKGRPFLVEFMNPCRVTFSHEDLKQLQKKVNGDTSLIKITDLQMVTREQTSTLKEGEIDKIKCYSALCWSEREITQSELDKLSDKKDLVLIQTTPIRVLHRRPNSERERTIHTMSAVLSDSHHFRLDLSTQAGTYIKEFVHGDFGRTRPSLGELLNTDCDILELDVEEVKLNWPPALENS